MLYEHIPCDLCGCQHYKVLYRQPDMWLWLNQFEFPVVKCVNCGLVYVNPRPTIETMRYYYPANYHEGRDTEQHTLRYKNQSRFLPNLNHKKVLDIGCAKGDFLKFLKDLYPDMEAYGQDIYSEVNYNFIKFCNKPFPECGYESEYFDYILSFAVFEHLHKPRDYFMECGRILAKGGEMCILVTNSDSLYSRYSRKEDIPRHLYHYNEKTLKMYGELAGLELVDVVYDNTIFDGKGDGAIRWFTSELIGLRYHDYYFKTIPIYKKVIMKIASVVDKIIFSLDWERYLRRSGIIIAKYRKY